MSRGPRNEREIYQARVAVAVTWVAGFVDAVGYLALYGIYTANMSGNSVGMGIRMAYGSWPRVLQRGWPVAMFVAGLLAAAVLLEAGQRKRIRTIVGWTLALELSLLAAFIVFGSPMVQGGEVHAAGWWSFYAIVALPSAAMGIQDATITRMGGLSIRTTHVTGTLVQFGKAASEYLFWLHDRTAGRTRARLLKALRVSGRQTCFREGIVMGSLWVAYVVGGICGAALKLVWELKSLALPVAVLAILVGWDFVQPHRVSRIENGTRP